MILPLVLTARAEMLIQLSFLLISALAGASAVGDAIHDKHSLATVVVGSFADAISTFQFDPASGSFSSPTSVLPSAISGSSPSFLGLSPDSRFLFAVNEVSEFQGHDQTGGLSSYLIGHDASLTKISSAFTQADPVSLDVSPDGKNVIVAAYTAGSASRFAVNEHGAFASTTPLQTFHYNHSGPNPTRQAHSFIHQAKYDASGRLAFFTDLGGDKVYVHKVLDGAGNLAAKPHEIDLEPGSGPRHLSVLEVHPGVYHVYVICELSNQIFFVQIKETYTGLESKIQQVVSTLSDQDVQRAATFGAGEIAMTKDERFIYGTNRQTDLNRPESDNSFVVFRRDPKTGSLSSPAFFPILVGGKIPRHFSFSDDPRQSLVVVGCQGADTLLMYSRTPETGALELLASTHTPKPAVQIFLPTRKSHERS